VHQSRLYGSLLAALAITFALAGVANASASSPEGSPWIVSLGDSFISGESGRWAGNSNVSFRLTDALGPGAYFDNSDGTAEQIKGCHRSQSAAVHIGSRWAQSRNFACSGAITTTIARDEAGNFKPGIDFYEGSEGVGQLVSLRDFARTHNVEVIAVSIGGNDFNFAPIIKACLSRFLFSSSLAKKYCRNDPAVTSNFNDENIAARTEAIRQAYQRIGEAMQQAGYEERDYNIIAQDYPGVVPPSSLIRYREATFKRQSVGGCGLYNKDIDWALDTALPAISNAVDRATSTSGLGNIRRLELNDAFRGHRLCERGAKLVEKDPGRWNMDGAVDTAEWISQIRTLSTIGTPYYLEEGFHPNYWGQLALRSCMRWVFRALMNDDPRTRARCVANGNGLNGRGEPRMQLVE